MEPRILVVGAGNEDRGDDGVGLVVARQLSKALEGRVRVVEVRGELDELLNIFSNCERAIIIDAARSGAAPGTIHTFDAASKPIPVSWFHHSTHAFGVAEALELARVLNRLPARVLVYGIEGNDFEIGHPMSPEVLIGAEKVAGIIVGEVQGFAVQISREKSSRS
jgi:hydrogenase maturation protease